MKAVDKLTTSPQALIATVVFSVVIAACGVTSTPSDTARPGEMATARRQLEDHMAGCTRRYGYDPEAGTKLGPHVLGRGEREWRDCVYQAIETYMIPRTLSPDLYRRLIAQDRKMTDAVAKGEMARAERQARVRLMIEEIDRIEEANRAKPQGQTLDRLVMEMRQDMRQRSTSPLLR